MNDRSERTGMLRVGVVLRSLASSAWVAKVIEEIQSGDFAGVEAVILTPGFPAHRHSFLFSRYERWDYGRNKVAHDALAPSDLSPILAGIPVVSVPLSSNRIAEDRREAVQGLNLDVLLSFDLFPADCFPARGFIGAARYGVWTFHFSGDETEGRNDPPLFWPVFDRNPVSPSALHISFPAESRIASQGHAATDPASLYRTRNPILWKAAEAAVRSLRELNMRGADWIALLPLASPAPGPRRTVNSLTMARFMGLEICRWIKARAAARNASGVAPKWCIWIRPRTEGHAFDDPSGYTMMPSARDRFYADPFLFERDGKTLLFFEDFRYSEGRAVISCCELAADGTPGDPFEVLRRPYHLSYPFLFADGGEMYMIPETRGNRAIELYRATSFPTGWVQEGVLLSDIDAVDSTIQRIDGKLWMFTGVSNGAYSNSDELAIFFSETLRGPWLPHPQNPVIGDVQRARPAGMLFSEAGRLIRPSQDCGKAYGYALIFSEILTLTVTEYKERVIGRILPETIPHAISNHTYNRTERFEVVDRTLPASIANGGDA